MTGSDALLKLALEDVSHKEMVECFQAMIDDGTAWRVEGTYGRQAVALIEARLCHKFHSGVMGSCVGRKK